MLAAIKNALDPYSDRCRRRSDYTQWHASPQVLKQDIVREPVLWQDIVQKPNRAMYAPIYSEQYFQGNCDTETAQE